MATTAKLFKFEIHLADPNDAVATQKAVTLSNNVNCVAIGQKCAAARPCLNRAVPKKLQRKFWRSGRRRGRRVLDLSLGNTERQGLRNRQFYGVNIAP